MLSIYSAEVRWRVVIIVVHSDDDSKKVLSVGISVPTVSLVLARYSSEYARIETSRIKTMIEYAVVIEKTGNGWSAYVPDLDGCIAAADSETETLQFIRE